MTMVCDNCEGARGWTIEMKDVDGEIFQLDDLGIFQNCFFCKGTGTIEIDEETGL